MGTCTEHEGDCIIKNGQATLEGQTITAEIHYMDNDPFTDLINSIFAERYSSIRLRFTRGFTAHGHIYVRKSSWLAVDTLIKHEFGHLFDLQHTWKFTLMNPTWIFRWFRHPKIDLEITEPSEVDRGVD